MEYQQKIWHLGVWLAALLVIGSVLVLRLGSGQWHEGPNL